MNILRGTLVGPYPREYPEWAQQSSQQYWAEPQSVDQWRHTLDKYNAQFQASLQNNYKSPARLSLEAAQKKAAEIRSRHPEMQVRRIKG